MKQKKVVNSRKNRHLAPGPSIHVGPCIESFENPTHLITKLSTSLKFETICQAQSNPQTKRMKKYEKGTNSFWFQTEIKNFVT